MIDNVPEVDAFRAQILADAVICDGTHRLRPNVIAEPLPSTRSRVAERLLRAGRNMSLAVGAVGLVSGAVHIDEVFQTDEHIAAAVATSGLDEVDAELEDAGFITFARVAFDDDTEEAIDRFSASVANASEEAQSSAKEISKDAATVAWSGLFALLSQVSLSALRDRRSRFKQAIRVDASYRFMNQDRIESVDRNTVSRLFAYDESRLMVLRDTNEVIKGNALDRIMHSTATRTFLKGMIGLMALPIVLGSNTTHEVADKVDTVVDFVVPDIKTQSPEAVVDSAVQKITADSVDKTLERLPNTTEILDRFGLDTEELIADTISNSIDELTPEDTEVVADQNIASMTLSRIDAVYEKFFGPSYDFLMLETRLSIIGLALATLFAACHFRPRIFGKSTVVSEAFLQRHLGAKERLRGE